MENGLALGPQIGIGIRRDRLSIQEELVALGTDYVIFRQGNDEDEDNGQEAHQCHSQKQRVEQEVRHGMDPVQTAHGITGINFGFLSHRDPPPIRSARWTCPPCGQWHLQSEW